MNQCPHCHSIGGQGEKTCRLCGWPMMRKVELQDDRFDRIAAKVMPKALAVVGFACLCCFGYLLYVVISALSH